MSNIEPRRALLVADGMIAAASLAFTGGMRRANPNYLYFKN
jgi:hypothetical protein